MRELSKGYKRNSRRGSVVGRAYANVAQAEENLQVGIYHQDSGVKRPPFLFQGRAIILFHTREAKHVLAAHREHGLTDH